MGKRIKKSPSPGHKTQTNASGVWTSTNTGITLKKDGISTLAKSLFFLTKY